jgi:hypothetical protein
VLGLAQLAAGVGDHPLLNQATVMALLPAQLCKLGKGQARAGARLFELCVDGGRAAEGSRRRADI